jgi:hypothetical protein
MWKCHLEMKKHAANKALHRTAIPLRYIAAGELGRYAELARELGVADGTIRDACLGLKAYKEAK